MIGIIAGTGVEKLAGLSKGENKVVVSRFGHAVVREAFIEDRKVLFLPRHDENHSTPPHLVNNRANIAALKRLGATHIIGICSVGSLRVDLPPGTLVLLQDFINAAGGRVETFYMEPSSPVIHTDMSCPYCPNDRKAIIKVCKRLGIDLVSAGTYVGVTGPRYETPAEIRAFRAWGGDVVGMTNIPECVLSREAGICYSAISIVTNYGTGLMDAGPDHTEVTKAAESVLPVIEKIVTAAAIEIDDLPKCPCQLTSSLTL